VGNLLSKNVEIQNAQLSAKEESYIEDVIREGMDCVGRDPETNQPKYRQRGWTTEDAHSTWIMPLPLVEERKRQLQLQHEAFQ